MAPKWQAFVTPSSKAFVFPNGLKVRTMWELKKALLNLPEDVVNHHLKGKSNDIGVWVKEAVEDSELAEKLLEQTHRWGMIVALERQMMRTLDLPAYLANRWLREVEQKFTFLSGEEAGSLEELAHAIGKVESDVIGYHGERQPGDIAVWVHDIVGDYELAEMMDETVGKLQLQQFVEDRLVMLEDAREC